MIRILALLTMALLCGGCSLLHPVQVKPPPAPAAVESALDAVPAKGPSRSEAPAPIEPITKRPVWWAAFADPALDSAIQEALRYNYFIRDVRTLITENSLDPQRPQGFWWPLQIGLGPSA